MSGHQYTAQVIWSRDDAVFTDQRYSRGHKWRFDGGIEVPASSSPLVVRPPLSVTAAVDPEEAFIAALSSCHMLFFLSFAARGGFLVNEYVDDAIGIMGKNPAGRTAVTKVTLRPRVSFAEGRQPTPQELHGLHHKAHEECFIANSVTTEVRCEPVEAGTVR